MKVDLSQSEAFFPNRARRVGWEVRAQLLAAAWELPRFEFKFRYPVGRGEVFGIARQPGECTDERYAAVRAGFAGAGYDLWASTVYRDQSVSTEWLLECDHACRWRLEGQVLRCDRCGLDGT